MHGSSFCECQWVWAVCGRVFYSIVPCKSGYQRIFWDDARMIKTESLLREPPLPFNNSVPEPNPQNTSNIPSLFIGTVSGSRENVFGIYLCKISTAVVTGITINRDMWKWRTSSPILIFGTTANCLAKEWDWRSRVPKGRKRKFNCVDPYWWGRVIGRFVPV